MCGFGTVSVPALIHMFICAHVLFIDVLCVCVVSREFVCTYMYIRLYGLLFHRSRVTVYTYVHMYIHIHMCI